MRLKACSYLWPWPLSRQRQKKKKEGKEKKSLPGQRGKGGFCKKWEQNTTSKSAQFMFDERNKKGRTSNRREGRGNILFCGGNNSPDEKNYYRCKSQVLQTSATETLVKKPKGGEPGGQGTPFRSCTINGVFRKEMIPGQLRRSGRKEEKHSWAGESNRRLGVNGALPKEIRDLGRENRKKGRKEGS